MNSDVNNKWRYVMGDNIYTGVITIKYAIVVSDEHNQEVSKKLAKKAVNVLFNQYGKGVHMTEYYPFKIIKTKNKFISRMLSGGIRDFGGIRRALKKM